MSHKDDYDLTEKIKIKFKGMDYYVMPRYTHHYLDNDYEKFSLQILKNNLKPGSTFVDIGAHYGSYSLYAAQTAGSHVIAAEPVSENFQLLNLNVKANKLEALIKTYQYAASDENTEAEFNIPWASDSAGFYEHPNAETIRTQKVQVRKMDDVIKDQKVDIIKIDTEGHEVSVLQGLGRTLHKNPGVKLIIELNPECLRRAGRSADELLKFIKDLDKEIYMVDENSFSMSRITDDITKWQDYMGPEGYCNVYCVPRKNHKYLSFISHSPLTEGAELAMVDHIKAIRSRNMIGHVIVPGEGQLVDRLIEEGIGYTVIEGYSFWALSAHGESTDSADYQYRNSQNIIAATEITDVARRLHVTHIVNNTIVNPWGYPAARELGLPLIWMVHEYGDIDHNISFPHALKNIKEFIVKESDLVFCCSRAVRKTMLTGDKALDSKVHVVYNFIDVDAVTELSERAEGIKRTADLQLCIIGTLTEGKSQVTAIHAMAELKRQGIVSNIWLIGRGAEAYTAFLKSEVKKANLQAHVTFVGFNKNPHAFLKQADIALVCAPHEAFGRTTAEAMIVGTPVIGANAGGTTEMIEDGVSGLLFEPLNEKALVACIKKMLKTNTKGMVSKAHTRIISMIERKTLLDRVEAALHDIPLAEAQQTAYNRIFTDEWLSATRFFVDKQKQEVVALEQERTEFVELKQQLQATRDELERMLHSRSWRATKPLRQTVHMVRRLKGRK